MGRDEIMQEINDNLLKDDTVFEEASRMRLQRWGIEYGTSRSVHRRGGPSVWPISV